MLVGKKGKIIIDHHLEVAKISLRNSNNHKKVYLVVTDEWTNSGVAFATWKQQYRNSL